MNDDTPIEDLLLHLPSEVCMALMDRPLVVKANALLMIRQSIISMEERGANLDPVAYEAVLHGVSALAITAAELGSIVDTLRLQALSKDVGVKGT